MSKKDTTPHEPDPFDALNIDVSGANLRSTATAFASVSEFEGQLRLEHPEIAAQLVAMDNRSFDATARALSGRSESSAPFRPAKLPAGKARMRSVQALVDKGNEMKTTAASSSSATVTRAPTEKLPASAKIRKNSSWTTANVIGRMATGCDAEGPLSVLAAAVKRRSRVRIRLRSRARISRLISAVIVAFDKHWNLVLRDCDEIYLPNRFANQRLSPAGDMPPVLLYSKLSENLPPAVKYLQKSHCNTLTRHMACTFIKGDNVVLIETGERTQG